MYLCDNHMQFLVAIDDYQYTKWLDPDNPPCYRKGNVVKSYKGAIYK